MGRDPLRNFRRDELGQTVVLVALLFVILTGFTALAIDGGRFYMERRFLQNAADAAALRCANAKVNGMNDHDAQEQAERILSEWNLRQSPLGLNLNVLNLHDDVNHVYEPNIPSDTRTLAFGIKVTDRGCRVALRVDVPTIFLRVVSPGLATIGLPAQAYAKWNGGFLPVVVARYEDPPGPAPSYHDRLKQMANDTCPMGQEQNCPDSTVDFPGREFSLFGQGAKAYNDSSFRGNIALDIREFFSTVHVGYNEVDGNVNPDTVKNYEANWVLTPWGYPGPDLCTPDPATFLACAQVAINSGNTAGSYVDVFAKRYKVGDLIMLQVYDGYVKGIPDFNLTNVSVVNIGTTETLLNVGTFKITGSAQFKAPGTSVTLNIEADGMDPDNPISLGTMNTGVLTPLCPSPPPDGSACGYGQPDFNSPWTSLATLGAQQGIYQIYLHGRASAPYETLEHFLPIVLNVGNQQKDFDTSGSATNVFVTEGQTANYTLQFKAKAGWTTAVNLQVFDCPATCYFDATPGKTNTTVTPTGSGANVTFTVTGTTGLQHRRHFFKIFAKGTDSDGNPVAHVIEMTLDVETGADGATTYVDVLGYALFRISSLSSPNYVLGQAVSGLRYDPNHPDLARGKLIRLVPWDTSP